MVIGCGVSGFVLGLGRVVILGGCVVRAWSVRRSNTMTAKYPNVEQAEYDQLVGNFEKW
jgi:hypothetical protein